jgi:hypothetical protein
MKNQASRLPTRPTPVEHRAPMLYYLASSAVLAHAVMYNCDLYLDAEP